MSMRAKRVRCPALDHRIYPKLRKTAAVPERACGHPGGQAVGIPEHLRTKKFGRATLHFDVLFGRVAAEKKWAETRVWGDGGGGYVGKHGGHLNSVRIGSTVDLNQEIWLD